MHIRCRPLLGTFVEIGVPEAHAAAVDAAFAAIERVHRLMSFHDGSSDLARMRAAPAAVLVDLDPETVIVLAEAKRLHTASGGLFDVTVGRDLVEAGFLPGDGIDDPSRYDGTMDDIVILDEHSVWLTARVLVDLGGIAKGHAVDRAVEVLQAQGVPDGCVNAGGDLRLFGARDWPVSLRESDGVVRQEIVVRDCAVASSENRANRRTAGGKVLTPHLGRGREPLVAKERVTVIANSCMLADAMTKIALADRALAARLLGGDGAVLLPLTRAAA
jgi:thiamine biosynthesis lipoprotein